MNEKTVAPGTTDDIPAFERDLFGGGVPVSGIGGGGIGGKANGLVSAVSILERAFPDGEFRGIRISVPSLVVIGTDVFDRFIAANGLAETLATDLSDERIAAAFQSADFPAVLVGDLRGLAEKAKTPLAVRSSSLLEDATREPFAGVYATKMVPNNQPDAGARFKKLVEAIKLVWASTYFEEARAYRRMTGRDEDSEKMAVIVQEVVGRRHQDRFYPTISGVARSWNYYPSGSARPEEGVVDLALGLGKTIVDGANAWSYSPAHPKADPPMTISDMLKQTQTEFWSVNMGRPPEYDPIRETEYLEKAGIADAEMDASLDFVASTYVAANDRIMPGIGRPGPRILNFSPILRMGDVPLNDLVRELLERCAEDLGTGVEIEFAVALDPLRRDPPRFGFVQVRPILVSTEDVTVTDEELDAENALVGSERVLGHGEVADLVDVVWVRPDTFAKEATPKIAREIAELNLALRAEGRKAILVTFGRLGSRDPWLGVPVNWDEISQAKAIVEATLPDMDVDLSQGSHFFHNMTSLRISFFSVHHAGPRAIRWGLAQAAETIRDLEYVRWSRLDRPARVLVDGRRGRGVILL